MSEHMREERKEDICTKTRKKFVDTQEGAERCEGCDRYEICPVLNL